MNIIIDNISYKINVGKIGFDIPNVWGMNGIETVKRKNPFRDPQGNLTVGESLTEWHVYVQEDLITFTLRFRKDDMGQDVIINTIREINNSYPSIGWGLLSRFNY